MQRPKLSAEPPHTSKPFAELPNLMASAKKAEPPIPEKIKRDHKLVEPVYIRLLVDHFKSHRIVADMLELSSLSNIMAEGGKARAASEKLAKYIYQDEVVEKPTPGDMVFISMLVTRDVWDQLQPWAEANNINAKAF